MAKHLSFKNYYYFYFVKGKEGLPEPVLRAGQRRFHPKTEPYDTGTSGMSYLP